MQNLKKGGGDKMNQIACELIREARKAKKLKQSDVAGLMGFQNNRGTTISNWETGVAEPSIDDFVKLCGIYEIDFTEILKVAYGNPEQEKTVIECNSTETEMIKKFRKLNEESQEFVLSVLEREYQRGIPLSKKKLSAEVG